MALGNTQKLAIASLQLALVLPLMNLLALLYDNSYRNLLAYKEVIQNSCLFVLFRATPNNEENIRKTIREEVLINLSQSLGEPNLGLN